MEVKPNIKIKFFAWKLICNLLLIKDKLRNFDININDDYPSCDKDIEATNHLVIKYEFSYNT